jgi:hypothetical protein
MEIQSKKSNTKDFFINLSAIVALYVGVISLLNLLFTAINTAYPKITNGYSYFSSGSISLPVATLIIFFPIFLLMMWFLEREYKTNPEKQNSGIHRWFTYITLFLSGLTIATDLITVLYYFFNGEELTTGFLLKVFVLLVVAFSIFIYYISDLRDKLTAKSRVFWRIFAGAIVIGSIIWGFSVLGSPRTQRLYKYDEQKVNALMNINGEVNNYYATKGALPKTIEEMANGNYHLSEVDPQTKKPYEYAKTGNTTYDICAEFNKASPEATSPNVYARPIGYISWTHPAGHYCFNETINPNTYPFPKGVPVNY